MAEDDEDSDIKISKKVTVDIGAFEYLLNVPLTQTTFVSPINLNIATMKCFTLEPLVWHHADEVCKKMKVLNSGHTIILSAKWFEERPYITGGALPGNYVFSQLHFHWGATDLEGSEHTVDGTQYPLEMHVVHFKSCYLTQESALLEKDGMFTDINFGTNNPPTGNDNLLMTLLGAVGGMGYP